MEYEMPEEPLEPETNNPSLASEIHNTTRANGSVKPEDYPHTRERKAVEIPEEEPAVR